jgi:hypothetical protein
MALTTGQIKLVYPYSWPSITSTGTLIGGVPVTGSVVSSVSTGIFPTGASAVPGGTTYVRYSKLFFLHTGNSAAGDSLQNPIIYIANEDISDQISIAPDPYWLGSHAAQTGTATGRSVLPDSLTASHFTGYTADNPLSFNTTLTSGNSIGFWVKMSIAPGMTSRTDNSFDIVLRGDIV